MRKQIRKQLVLLRKIVLQNNVALSSYPRSGNTWLSKLVEELSGKQTGSIHPYNAVFQRPVGGIIIKTHKRDAFRYNRFIHLVRNPFDAIASYYEFVHVFYSDKADDWETHVRKQCAKWKDHTEYWMQQTEPHITMRYEDLIHQPFESLEKVAQFLELTVGDAEIERAIEACTIEKLRAKSLEEGSDGNNFFNKGEVGSGRTRFSSTEVAALEGELGELMKRFHYELTAN